MTTAIVYYSKHHGNTKKLLDAIAASDASVTLIDTTEQKDADLSAFDLSFSDGKLIENLDNAFKGDPISEPNPKEVT